MPGNQEHVMPGLTRHPRNASSGAAWIAGPRIKSGAGLARNDTGMEES
jgi:hypothetical protein